MTKNKKSTVSVQGTAVTILSHREEDNISLTDIAGYKDSERTDYIIQNWMRNRNTTEFLGLWERLNNSGFKPIEFEGFKNQAGRNSFVMTAKRWLEGTGAIGLILKSGRYGGTFSYKDIAFEFASWVSIEFKLYFIKESQCPEEDESRRLSLSWNATRMLTKINYWIHTDTINPYHHSSLREVEQ